MSKHNEPVLVPNYTTADTRSAEAWERRRKKCKAKRYRGAMKAHEAAMHSQSGVKTQTYTLERLSLSLSQPLSLTLTLTLYLTLALTPNQDVGA